MQKVDQIKYVPSQVSASRLLQVNYLLMIAILHAFANWRIYEKNVLFLSWKNWTKDLFYCWKFPQCKRCIVKNNRNSRNAKAQTINFAGMLKGIVMLGRTLPKYRSNFTKLVPATQWKPGNLKRKTLPKNGMGEEACHFLSKILNMFLTF